MRLAAAMTEKAALAGLAHGGGKTVVALDPYGAPLTDASRRELLQDIGDVVKSLDGQYWTGPDVGSSPEDMAVISERTEYVFCRPQRLGGSGDSSGPTAAGVLACIRAVREHVLAGQPLTQTFFSIVGLGHVGQLVAEHLASSGARLIVSDIDPRRRELAERWHAGWLEPEEAILAEVDVLVPAAVGGVLTPSTVAALRCRAVVGPANNQLDADSTADLLHARGITWAPTPLSAPAESWQLPDTNYGTSPTTRSTVCSPVSVTVSVTSSKKRIRRTRCRCRSRANRRNVV